MSVNAMRAHGKKKKKKKKKKKEHTNGRTFRHMSSVNSANNSPSCKSLLSGFESATSVTARRRRPAATVTAPTIGSLLDVFDALELLAMPSLVDANSARRVVVLVSRWLTLIC
jgi:uncharacterized surface protein with fasciclin (FAS1) repeats